MISAPRSVTPVGILATKLAQLTQQIDALDSVDVSIKAELRHACELANGLDPYVAHCTTP